MLQKRVIDKMLWVRDARDGICIDIDVGHGTLGMKE